MPTDESQHPGRLLELLLETHAITPYRCAKDCGIPPKDIYNLQKLRRGVTPNLAVRLGRYFDNGPIEWLLQQAHHDVQLIEAELVETLERIPMAPKKGGQVPS